MAETRDDWKSKSEKRAKRSRDIRNCDISDLRETGCENRNWT
jgi:hypothetical protein